MGLVRVYCNSHHATYYLGRHEPLAKITSFGGGERTLKFRHITSFLPLSSSSETAVASGAGGRESRYSCLDLHWLVTLICAVQGDSSI